MLNLPRVYPIVDLDYVADPLAHAAALLDAGATLVQMRAKAATARRAYEAGLALRALTRGRRALLAVNDRPDLAAAVEADWLHLGQDDMPPAMARTLFAGPIGLSTHNLAQVAAAASEPVAYLGFGPVFATTTKEHPDPVTGTALLAAAVAAAGRPIVAIGGITLSNAPLAWAAGAASVAVISALGRTAEEARAAYARWKELET